MIQRTLAVAVGVLWISLAAPVGAQVLAEASRAGSGPNEKQPAGIPVSDPLVLAKCGTCHKNDGKGNLSRISWERTTPEGWEEVIKRMVRLNGLTLTPTDARSIVRSLSASHGLAPEEAQAVAYIAEHRIVQEAIPNDNLKTTCASCHPFGRVASFRRSPDEWKRLADLHVALFPIVELTAFRRREPRGGAVGPQAAQPPPQPIDQAIEFLSRAYPLETPEWAAWRARARDPRLAGKWLVSGHIAGRGDFWGEMSIDAGPAPDEFTSHVKLLPLGTGPAIERTGKVSVFNGYLWRGRSKGAASGAGPGDIPAEMRESMMISADQSRIEGRWFWGAYSEFGADLKMQRATGSPQIVAVDRHSLRAGAQAQRIRVLGDHLQEGLSPAQIDFGSGINVRRVVSSTAHELVAEVDVAENAISGRRDIVVASAVLPNAIAVYDRVDYIRVLPETPIARLGGASRHPKGYQQFEARAYQRGADNQSNTADDVELGAIDVSWSVEEFFEVFGDDDKQYVGALSPTGLFTPALDGPNPQRKQMRDNYGSVWVVATAKTEKDKNGKALTAKGYLVVSPPLFVVWDQEIAP